MKTAGLPSAKTIEEYDFTFHPQLNKKEVMALFDQDTERVVTFLRNDWSV